MISLFLCEEGFFIQDRASVELPGLGPSAILEIRQIKTKEMIDEQ